MTQLIILPYILSGPIFKQIFIFQAYWIVDVSNIYYKPDILIILWIWKWILAYIWDQRVYDIEIIVWKMWHNSWLWCDLWLVIQAFFQRVLLFITNKPLARTSRTICVVILKEGEVCKIEIGGNWKPRHMFTNRIFWESVNIN